MKRKSRAGDTLNTTALWLAFIFLPSIFLPFRLSRQLKRVEVLVPVSLRIPIRRISQEEFGKIFFEVLRHVFDIHNQIGRFFNETIYKRELALRMPGVRLEEPIDVVFESFRKRYFVDVLVHDGAVFEPARHRLGQYRHEEGHIHDFATVRRNGRKIEGRKMKRKHSMHAHRPLHFSASNLSALKALR